MGKKSSNRKKGGKARENHVGSDSRDTVIKSDRIVRILKKSWVLGLLLFAVSFLIYAPSLGNDFVWDDVINITKQSYKFENKSLFKNLIPKEREKKKSGYYRPVVNSSIVIDYYFWNDNPFGYHLTNNLLFSLSSLLFFSLILLILKDFHVESREYIAAAATLIHIVHPMHVESVSWIAGRSDIICTVFFLAAFIFHILSYRKLYFLPLTLIMLALSFLSKELAVAFPFVALSYDILRSGDLKLKNYRISLFYFILFAFYLSLRGRGLLNIPNFSDLTVGIPQGSSPEFLHYLKSVVIVLNSYFFYFLKMVFPFKFSAFISDVPMHAAYTFLSIILFTGFGIWSYFSIMKRSGLKAFAIIWMILALGPSVLVSILSVATTPLAERYLFLPLCGFSLLISYSLFAKIKKKESMKFVAAFFLVFTLLLYFNISRQSVWADRVSFWNDISQKSDATAASSINRGIALIENGKVEEGIEVLESFFKTGSSAPGRLKSMAANNIGVGYLNKNDHEIARHWFAKAIEFDPSFHKSYFHIALIDYTYGVRNNSYEYLKKAEINSRKALTYDRRYSRAYLLLAKIYFIYNDIETAKEYAGRSIDLGLQKSLHPQALEIINR